MLISLNMFVLKPLSSFWDSWYCVRLSILSHKSLNIFSFFSTISPPLHTTISTLSSSSLIFVFFCMIQSTVNPVEWLIHCRYYILLVQNFHLVHFFFSFSLLSPYLDVLFDPYYGHIYLKAWKVIKIDILNIFAYSIISLRSVSISLGLGITFSWFSKCLIIFYYVLRIWNAMLLCVLLFSLNCETYSRKK